MITLYNEAYHWEEQQPHNCELLVLSPIRDIELPEVFLTPLMYWVIKFQENYFDLGLSSSRDAKLIIEKVIKQFGIPHNRVVVIEEYQPQEYAYEHFPWLINLVDYRREQDLVWYPLSVQEKNYLLTGEKLYLKQEGSPGWQILYDRFRAYYN